MRAKLYTICTKKNVHLHSLQSQSIVCSQSVQQRPKKNSYKDNKDNVIIRESVTKYEAIKSLIMLRHESTHFKGLF